MLEKALGFHRPSNPNFVYHPVEINAGCWKVIEHLTTFAEAIFNAQAREYVKHYPALVFGGDLLTAEVGPEVVKRTKLRWTRWETEIDWALRVRWPPEYYRAYVEEANQPGSEDQKLVEHFLRRLAEIVADRNNFWREQAKAGDHGTPPKPEHVARTTLGEPSRAASGPPVAYGGAAPSTDGTADGTEGQTQGSLLRRDKHDSSARDGAMTAQIERTVASAEQEAADSNAGGASDPPATRVAEPPSVAAKDSHSGPASHRAKLIDAQLTARLNNGESRDQAVCEAIQQCFDVLVELHLEGGGTLNDQLLLRVFPDQVFELGVDLNWLPAAMGADRNFWPYQEWFSKLLAARVKYFGALLLGRPSSYTPEKPGFVVIPIPDTDPLMRVVESHDALKELNAQQPKDIPEEVMRMGVEARGVPPGSTFDAAFLFAGADLAAKYGQPVSVVAATNLDEIQNAASHLPPYWEDPTPVYYFERWPLQALRGPAKGRIKAKLAKIHADILENKAGQRPEIEGWRWAYNVFASEFEAANLLTEDLIRKTIPEMVADAGTSGRWAFGHFSSIIPSGDRSQRLGQEFYHPGRIWLFFKYIEGRIVEWSGKLDLRHSKEDGDAQHRPELDDDSETLTSGESESPEAHRAQVILFEQSEGSGALVEPEQRSEIAPALVTRVPLSEELRNAEARTADPKLQKRLTAVVRYTRYFDELKLLKTACKRYQTPALLQQQFPDLDVWAALKDDDKADIANGEFDPGRFAWSLVMRFLKLMGNDDRTLKNYRKALKAAGLL